LGNGKQFLITSFLLSRLYCTYYSVSLPQHIVFIVCYSVWPLIYFLKRIIFCKVTYISKILIYFIKVMRYQLAMVLQGHHCCNILKSSIIVCHCRPMIVIGGASERDQDQTGAFQEYPQVEVSRLYSKFSCQPSRVERIPFYVEKVYCMIRFCVCVFFLLKYEYLFNCIRKTCKLTE